MTMSRLLAAAAIMGLILGPGLAQPTTAPTKEAPPKAAPKAPPKAETPAAKPAPKPAPVAGRVNLNTASAEELDKLPQIGPARAKAIIEARSKGRFKNWDDFVARKVVPSNAQKAIMDLVTF